MEVFSTCAVGTEMSSIDLTFQHDTDLMSDTMKMHYRIESLHIVVSVCRKHGDHIANSVWKLDRIVLAWFKQITGMTF